MKRYAFVTVVLSITPHGAVVYAVLRQAKDAYIMRLTRSCVDPTLDFFGGLTTSSKLLHIVRKPLTFPFPTLPVLS